MRLSRLRGEAVGGVKRMLFSRKSESRGQPAPWPARTPASNCGAGGTRSQSFIDASLTVLGDLHSDGDIRLDGRICGNVTCAQLIVGKDAAITGTVKAEQTIVRGSITGTIRSSVVILQATARVESDITYTLLAIDDGAMFEGAAHRSGRPLEDTETASALAELERIVVAADHAGATNGSAANASCEAAPGRPAPPAAARPQAKASGG